MSNHPFGISSACILDSSEDAKDLSVAFVWNAFGRCTGTNEYGGSRIKWRCFGLGGGACGGFRVIA